MTSFKHILCAGAFVLAAGQSIAHVYPVTIDSSTSFFGLNIPVTATGEYDDVTGEGSWTLNLDLSVFGAGPISLDQQWTMDSATGNGVLSAPTSCAGDANACSSLTPFLQGNWTASPTPVGLGQYVFSLPTPLGTMSFNVVTNSTEPAVNIVLSLPSTTYECVNGGAQVAASSSVSLLNGAELESLAWYVDGQAVASTESLSEFLTLGQHTIKVVATITTGDSASAEKVVNITDNSAPVINAFFSDARSGDAITSVATKNTSFVVANFSATDTCDPNPAVEGFGGFGLSSGDTLKIQGNLDKVELNTSSIQMMVKATDSSGKTTQTVKTLSITP